MADKKKSKVVTKFDPNFGIHGGRRDLERWGLFAEMLYLHGLGMTAVPLYAKKDEKKQMLPGFPKWKTELQDCYFDNEFKRLFIGEAMSSLYKRDAKSRLEGKKLFRTPQGIRPPPGSKVRSTPGDFYGTFGGIVKAFDPRKRPATKFDAKGKKKPMSMKAGKRGGPGFADITINKFPEWKQEKYDQKVTKKVTGKSKGPFHSGGYGGYFNPNPFFTANSMPPYKKVVAAPKTKQAIFYPPKATTKLDGMKGGCISKYPEHSADKYHTAAQEKMGKQDKNKGKKGGLFKLNGGAKTWPIFSVMNLNVDFRTNVRQYRRAKPYTYTREFLHEIEF